MHLFRLTLVILMSLADMLASSPLLLSVVLSEPRYVLSFWLNFNGYMFTFSDCLCFTFIMVYQCICFHLDRTLISFCLLVFVTSHYQNHILSFVQLMKCYWFLFMLYHTMTLVIFNLKISSNVALKHR